MTQERTEADTPNIQVLDVMNIRHDGQSSNRSVKSFKIPKRLKTVRCDIFIAGGGTGGVAAALAAASAKNQPRICLIEETDWLGGQMTSQGVSALDENFLVESSGANRSYQSLRQAIRNYYRNNFALSESAQQEQYPNPGRCWVTRLSFEPDVAVNSLQRMLQEPVDRKQLQVFLRWIPVRVELNRGKIRKVIAVNLDTGKSLAFRAKVFLDATELGELLPMSGAHYIVGAADKAAGGEPSAPASPNPENVQDYVFPFVVELVPGTINVIEKPAHYDEFLAAEKFSFDGFKMFSQAQRRAPDGGIMVLEPFWTYRRLLDKSFFSDPRVPNDVAMINWSGNDFGNHNILDKTPEIMSRHMALAKACSLGFLYWLQTAAPRDDGGIGYPELKLRLDVLGTADGLSKYPYIREARRGKTLVTIKEQDIASPENAGARARLFDDAVGIGYYPIDIHGQEEIPGRTAPSKPFQIPLGALLPENIPNLILAAKNIGTTHITNGAYRLHPIEWAIGEAAGTLAGYVIEHPTLLKTVATKEKVLRRLQLRLIERGVPLYWYDDVPTSHPSFDAIQFLGAAGIMRGVDGDLHFNPDLPVSRTEAAEVLSRAFGKSSRSWQRLLGATSLTNPSEAGLTSGDLQKIHEKVMGVAGKDILNTPVSRSSFASWVFNLFKTRI